MFKVFSRIFGFSEIKEDEPTDSLEVTSSSNKVYTGNSLLMQWLKESESAPGGVLRDYRKMAKYSKGLVTYFGDIQDSLYTSYSLREVVRGLEFHIYYNEQLNHLGYKVDGMEFDKDEFLYLFDRALNNVFPANYERRISSLLKGDVFSSPYNPPTWMSKFSLTTGSHHMNSRTKYVYFTYKNFRIGREAMGSMHYAVNGNRVHAIKFFEEFDLYNLKP